MNDNKKRFDTSLNRHVGKNIITRERLLELSDGDYVYWYDKDGIIRHDLPSAVPEYALAQFDAILTS